MLASMSHAHINSRYQTLDNVDGKQARRTGTSSGLGELFEYAEDSEKAFAPLTPSIAMALILSTAH